MKRIRELDGLRCFAILAVLCVHYRPAFQTIFYPMSLGWVGVDLFFVLSGFLITTNLVLLRGTPHPYRRFYWRRLLRIVPPYYLVFGLIFVSQLINHIPIPPHLVFETLSFTTALTVLQPLAHVFYAISHLPLANTPPTPVDNHIFTSFADGVTICWSLSFEEMFYFAWAPIMLRCSLRTLVVVTSFTILFSPVLRLLAHSPHSREAFFFPFRFDGLAMGSLLAVLLAANQEKQVGDRKLRWGLRALIAAAFLALIPLCVESGILRQREIRSTLSFSALGYSLVGLMFTGLVGLIVLYQGGPAWWLKLLRIKPLAYIGTVSYMMYLIHVPVFGLMYSLLARFYHHSYLPGIGFALLCTTITVAIAGLSWKYFENPLLRYKDVEFGIKPKLFVPESTRSTRL